MKNLVLVLMLAAGTAAFAGRTAPVYTGHVDVGSNKSLEQIESAIRKGLVAKRWVVEDSKKGEIIAKVMVRKHVAKVKITYNKDKVTIAYMDSVNLNYEEKGGEPYIHGNYNRWIQHLEQHITANLF